MSRTDSKAKLEPPPPVYFHCSLSDYTPETPSQKNVSDLNNNSKRNTKIFELESTSNDTANRF